MDPRVIRIRLASAALACNGFPTRELFETLGSPERILRASPPRLARFEGLRPGVRRALSSVAAEASDPRLPAVLEERGIRVVSFEQPHYPQSLRHIPDPPPVLLLRGELRESDQRALAVIGSRKASPYGVSVCQRIVRDLALQGLCVVSGMARGIDAVAHWSALENGGRTLGVLGTGPDQVYPRSNKPLFERVPAQGALVSEFPPGTPAHARHFPRRNRIISGLCLGVLVVEARERSGTLITVRMALEQGREVFAVPGDIRSPLSRGTHRLIREGAKLVEGVADILEELPCASDRPPLPDARRSGEGEVDGEGGEKGRAILELLDDEGVCMDVLVRRTGWPLERLTAALTELELVGRVRRLPGNRFLRV